MIIAVDFDGTLCRDKYPEIGKPNYYLINNLKNNQLHGDTLILYTCRSGDLLESALSWLKSFDLIFDYVNENVPEMVNKYGSDTRKIHADLYIDDKAVKPYWR